MMIVGDGSYNSSFTVKEGTPMKDCKPKGNMKASYGKVAKPVKKIDKAKPKAKKK